MVWWYAACYAFTFSSTDSTIWWKGYWKHSNRWNTDIVFVLFIFQQKLDPPTENTYDNHNGLVNRPGSRLGITDPNRFSHYVNYEEIQQHLEWVHFIVPMFIHLLYVYSFTNSEAAQIPNPWTYPKNHDTLYWHSIQLEIEPKNSCLLDQSNYH